MKKYISAAIVVGLLLILYSFLNFSLDNLWDWISTVSLILGLSLLGAGVYYRLKFKDRVRSKRALQLGAASGLNTLIFVGILALLAFITTRHHARADLTQKGLFSLADQTKKVLEKLDKDVKIYAFYKEGDETLPRDLLEQYAYRSKHINFEFVDPNKKPQLAKQYNITQYGTVVVESNGRRETITELNEANLTNAILKATRDVEKMVCFTTGHGEKDIESEKPRGYKFIADGIRKDNYMVRTVNIIQDKGIPRECNVLIIAGPTTDFFPAELDSIKDYIERGGRVMVLVDPNWKPSIVEFLKQYNIQVDNDLIVDFSGVGQLFGMGPAVPLVAKYENHPMFKEFNVMTFFPEACSVRPLENGQEGITTTVLFKSAPRSWGETDFTAGKVQYDEGKDLKGPLSMAVLATKKLDNQKKAHVLVVGDSDFGMNAYVRNSGNYDLFLNMVNWLAEEEDMVTIRPKEFDDRRVTLTERDSKVVLYVSVIGLPLVIIIAGLMVYYRRR